MTVNYFQRLEQVVVKISSNYKSWGTFISSLDVF